MNEEEQRRRARELAEGRYGFRWHLGWYVAVNAGLVGIWFFTGFPNSPILARVPIFF